MGTQASIGSGALNLLDRQRSHVLLSFCNGKAADAGQFLEFYAGRYLEETRVKSGVLSARQYVQHAVDVTRGRHAPLPFQYLTIYELSIDGAEQAGPFIESIHTLCDASSLAECSSTWLYYPASEQVGRQALVAPSMLTVAFANSTPGDEDVFREWYATRHIRHALHIPALVSGQCYQRTIFQEAGAMMCAFSTIAIYEQEGGPEDIIKGFATVREGTLNFPNMDKTRGRFSECVFQPLGSNL